MTTTATVPSVEAHNASHDPAACCWLCSDQVEWWAELRRKHGLQEPPYARPVRRTALKCSECGRLVAHGPRCKSCAMARAWQTSSALRNRETYRGGPHRRRVPGAGYTGVSLEELRNARDDNRALSMG